MENCAENEQKMVYFPVYHFVWGHLGVLQDVFGGLILGHKGTAGNNYDFVGLVLCDLVSEEISIAGKVSADENFADLSKG